MQIAIDIPEELYETNNRGLEAEEIWDLRVAVKNGIPLPKGHGRLGDLDKLEKEIDGGIKAGLMIEGYENYSNINDMDDCLECVKYAPTIIEADVSDIDVGSIESEDEE